MYSGRKTLIFIGWFAFRYVFYGVILFGLIYFEEFSPLIFINDLQTKLSVFITQQWINILELPIEVEGHYFTFKHGLELTLDPECNGLATYLFLLTAIISYPSNIKQKIKWSILSYVILFIANTLRLNWIIYHVIDYPEDFIFVHDIIGLYSMVLLTWIIFYFFTREG